MNCEASSQLISRLLDNGLSDAEQAALREHLAQCPACEKLEWEQRRLHAAVGVPSGARASAGLFPAAARGGLAKS